MITIGEAARIAHEVNRAYCAAHGDTSQLAWDDAPKWQRDSVMAGLTAHLDSHAAGVPLTPRQSHEAWLAVKEADGWVYGPVKDAEAKVHPCMVPYDDLPEVQRIKDDLFTAVARAVHEAAVATPA